MNFQFPKSGLRAGDDQATMRSPSRARTPDVEIPGSNAGEGGQGNTETQRGTAALDNSGHEAGGEAADHRSDPSGKAQPSETPQKPRSRADVARLLTRSARNGGAAEPKAQLNSDSGMAQQQNSARKSGEDRTIPLLGPLIGASDPQNSPVNGGGEQAMAPLHSDEHAPAAKTSGREIGAGETKLGAIPGVVSSPRKISRREAGASDAILQSASNEGMHPGDTSGHEVGDEQAALNARSSKRPPAVQISGASASGDEAETSLPSRVRLPRRKFPSLAAGTDRSGRVLLPNVLATDPQSFGREAGAGRAEALAKPGHQSLDLQPSGCGRGDESQDSVANQIARALIAELVQLGRARRDWMKTRVGIELRAIAICRRFCGGDKDQAKVLWKAVRDGSAPDDLLFAVGPLLGPIGSLEEQEKRVDRQMTKLAGQHEMAAWAKAIRGFGHAGLAKVIAECGDIGSYRGPACVWKRMGLAVINGGRQRRVPGAEALEHGYNAERRSVMWNVGGAVIGGMGKGPRPLVGEDTVAREDLTDYQKLFVRRLRLEAERDPEAHAREPVTNKETGAVKESFSAHAANRAKRYVEKRLLRDLWIAWRRAGHRAPDTHSGDAGSPTPSGA